METPKDNNRVHSPDQMFRALLAVLGAVVLREGCVNDGNWTRAIILGASLWVLAQWNPASASDNKQSKKNERLTDGHKRN